MSMRDGAATRQSVAQSGLEMPSGVQVAAGFAGFLDLGLRLALTDLRGAVGLIAIGLPAGAVAA
jgi:hypothetical protein